MDYNRYINHFIVRGRQGDMGVIHIDNFLVYEIPYNLFFPLNLVAVFFWHDKPLYYNWRFEKITAF